MNQQPAQPGLFIGIDWADQKHDIHIVDRDGNGSHHVLEHSAENIDAYSIPSPPALCVSQERWPFPGLEILRCGITKPRVIFFGNGSQRGVTDHTARR